MTRPKFCVLKMSELTSNGTPRLRRLRKVQKQGNTPSFNFHHYLNHQRRQFLNAIYQHKQIITLKVRY